jgi:hypothetical protein
MRSPRVVHYVGFKDDRYWAAFKVFGGPRFIHRGWDLRARRDVGPEDLVIFANGEHDQAPRTRSFNDLEEGT